MNRVFNLLFLVYIMLGFGRAFLKRHSCVRNRRISCSSQTLAEVPSLHTQDQVFRNNRFWSNEFCIAVASGLSKQQIVEAIASRVRTDKTSSTNQTEQLIVPHSEFGIILIPSFNLLLPMHEGIAQPQHTRQYEQQLLETLPLQSGDNSASPSSSASSTDNSLSIIVCGFAPRAQHRIVDESLSEDRPLDAARLLALRPQLERICGIDITIEQLLTSEEYLGTPPSRIVRSFLFPRPHRSLPTVLSIETQAQRIAEQVSLALRRLRADRAPLLRNVDRAVLSDTTSVATETRSAQQTEPLTPEETLRKWLQTQLTTASLKHPVILVLDNLRSAHNVGSLFRTAETAHITGIITCGITAHPPYHEQLRKTAFQSLQTVATVHVEEITTVVRVLREEKVRVVLAETTENAVDYTDFQYWQQDGRSESGSEQQKVALVVGNEVSGVDARLLPTTETDMKKGVEVVIIPTMGAKNSLNVASAGAVLLFEILRQRRELLRKN